MAAPVDPNYTPTTPADPFQGGEQSAERQKQALVQLLAEQGTYGAKQLQNRADNADATRASAMQAQSPTAPMNATTQALYDVFTRDAGQSKMQQDQEQARILAANKAYMDQVGAAVPLARADNEAYTTAMKMQYEEAQRQREAELEQQRLANQRAAQAAAQAASSTARSYYDKQKEQRDAEMQLLMEDLRGKAPADRGYKDLTTLGLNGQPVDPETLAKDFGFSTSPEKYSGRTQKEAVAVRRLIDDIVQEGTSSGVSFNAIRQAANAALRSPETMSQYGFTGTPVLGNIPELYLASYAPMWGLDPKDLGFRYYEGGKPEPLPWG